MQRPKTLEMIKQVKYLFQVENLAQKEIAARLGIPLSRVVTYCASDKTVERRRQYQRRKYLARNDKPLAALRRKVTYFKYRAGFVGRCTVEFTAEDVLAKFGPNPVCYLTGEPIDWQDGNSYQLDHVTALSAGGLSNLDNLELAKPAPNMMKRHFTVAEYVETCRAVVLHSDRPKIGPFPTMAILGEP